jgi:hypothetical protein
MITLIWQCDYNTAWECDWLEYLFKDIPHNTIKDTTQTQYIDRSLIIFNATVNNDQYLNNLSAKGFQFGLIHLSDEWSKDSTDNYQLANVVMRNYYKDLGSKVINFPLGCMKTFPYDLISKTINQRTYTWSFSGHIDKTTRPIMAENMLLVDNGQGYFKRCGENWGPFQGHALNPVELANMYNDSIFVPCPHGNESIDSFRVCEALQAGALPIVETSDYWSKLYGNDHPLIEVDDWKHAPGLIKVLMQDLLTLEQKRLFTHNWWVKYCNNLRGKLKNIL